MPLPASPPAPAASPAPVASPAAASASPAAASASATAQQHEPGVISVDQLVQQPGRENLPVLHPFPRYRYSTWLVIFNYLYYHFFSRLLF